MNNFEKLKKILPGIKRKVELAPYTSFKIGGEADFFYEASSKNDLAKAVKTARKLGIAYFILGGGSNLLFSDEGFRGLVVRVRDGKYKIVDEKIVAWAGVLLSELVEAAARRGLSGLEALVGIPGTLGGAIFGNSGVNQRAIGNMVSQVKVLGKKGEIEKLGADESLFSYRKSRFQTSGEIILEATLNLKRVDKARIRNRMRQFMKKRKNQPKLPSAGSVFMNPPGDSAGRLVEACGLKGKRVGDAQISPLHANWIVNLGEASCRDVLKLIRLVKTEVRAKFGMGLELEIRLAGIKDGKVYY